MTKQAQEARGKKNKGKNEWSGEEKVNRIHKLIIWKDQWNEILAGLIKKRGEKEKLHIDMYKYTMKSGGYNHRHNQIKG